MGRGRQAAPSWQSCETMDETAIFYFCKTHTLMWIYLYVYIYVYNVHTYAFTYSYIVLCTNTKINTCITIIFYICHYMHSYYVYIYRYILYTLYFNKYTCLRRFSPSSNHSPLFLLVLQTLDDAVAVPGTTSSPTESLLSTSLSASPESWEAMMPWPKHVGLVTENSLIQVYVRDVICHNYSQSIIYS